MSEYKKNMFRRYKQVQIILNTGRKLKGRNEKNAYKLKNKIDRCVKLLGDPYSEVFRNTYLSEVDKLWWTSFYSSSSYYRYLKSAREHFFQLFYRGRV